VRPAPRVVGPLRVEAAGAQRGDRIRDDLDAREHPGLHIAPQRGDLASRSR
jgi:hypothetical protein